MQEKIEWVKAHIMDILIWGLIGFFALLYISLLFNYNIGTDEAFTLGLLKGNIKEIIEGTAEELCINLQNRDIIKGEFAVFVSGTKKTQLLEEDTDN